MLVEFLIYLHVTILFTFTFMHLADALSKATYSAVHSGYTFISVAYVCSLGTEPTTFYAANTMLYHWAT